MCLAPEENSAFCLAMALMMKMPLQLAQKFAVVSQLAGQLLDLFTESSLYPFNLLISLLWTATINVETSFYTHSIKMQRKGLGAKLC